MRLLTNRIERRIIRQNGSCIKVTPCPDTYESVRKSFRKNSMSWEDYVKRFFMYKTYEEIIGSYIENDGTKGLVDFCLNVKVRNLESRNYGYIFAGKCNRRLQQVS
jgi:hypothetical protein